MKKLFEFIKANKDRYLTLILSMCAIYSLLIASIFDSAEMQRNIMYILVVVVMVQTWLSLHQMVDRKSRETSKLQELIEYNQKRKEIDEEIARLSRSLMKSDVGQFIDFNRLAFSGQLSTIYSDAINYETFLERFGIRGSETVI